MLVPMEVWPHVGTSLAASRANEPGLEIGQADIIGPSIAADRDVMAALVVGAIDEKPAHAGGAHLAEGDFLGTRVTIITTP